MLMSLPELVTKYDLDIHGVLHVGAHLAEEAADYDHLGLGPVLWVEANPAVIDIITANLITYPDQRVVQALVYSEDHMELDFHVTNYDGMSSSIYEFGTHTQFSPDTVFVETLRLKTRTIDRVTKMAGFYDFNFLNMDLQGAELHALMGATETLKHVDYVMSEVNKAEVYKGCARVEELDEILSDFERVETYWVGNQGWGDALYVRTT